MKNIYACIIYLSSILLLGCAGSKVQIPVTGSYHSGNGDISNSTSQEGAVYSKNANMTVNYNYNGIKNEEFVKLVKDGIMPVNKKSKDDSLETNNSAIQDNNAIESTDNKRSICKQLKPEFTVVVETFSVENSSDEIKLKLTVRNDDKYSYVKYVEVYFWFNENLLVSSKGIRKIQGQDKFYELALPLGQAISDFHLRNNSQVYIADITIKLMPTDKEIYNGMDCREFSVTYLAEYFPPKTDNYVILFSSSSIPRVFSETHGNLSVVISYYENIFDNLLNNWKADSLENIIRLAYLYEIEKEYSKLEEFYKKLIEKNEAEGYNGLAWFYSTTDSKQFQKYKEALKLAIKANEITDYKNPSMLDTLAEAHFVNGEITEAVELNKKAQLLNTYQDNYELTIHLNEANEKYLKALKEK